MCGIAATIAGGPERLERILAHLHHRGPDGSGTWVSLCGSVHFGHARLAIMDPRPRSDQPFERGPLHLIYNGEIYNYRQLRRELEAVGERFVTTGDTEVVAAALLRWGTGALAKFEGMFALVVHDERDASVIAARDEFGIKPLYWRADGETVSISSELRSLVDGEPAVHEQALREFLQLGAPITRPIDGRVNEQSPGTWIRWAEGAITVASFTGDPRNDDDDRPISPAAALRRSIIDHAQADRPMALYLSGGFDSAVVLAGLREAGAEPLALTLDTGSNAEDLERARATARHYAVDHEVIRLDHSNLSAHLDRYFTSMDQPGIDGFNTSLISAACVDAGYPVALSGLGGDEMLGGYRYYRLESRLRSALPQLQRLPDALLRRAVGFGASRLGTTNARLGDLMAADGVAARHRAFRALFSADEVSELAGRPADRTSQWVVDPTASPRQQLATLDAATYLRPTLLRDADVHSMAHSVELRVPFVDRRVRDAVFAADEPPTKDDLAHAWGDAFLVAKAREPKLTFRLPWHLWVTQILDDQRELLSRPDPWHGWLDPSAAKRHLAEPDLHGEPLRPWALVSLARWLDRQTTARHCSRSSAPHPEASM